MCKIFFFFFSFHSLVFINLSAENDSTPRPTACFSVVFWGDSSVRSLFYAPWGNLGEVNSTKCKVRGAYGSLSTKCVYYGQTDISFHQPIEVLNTQDEDGIEPWKSREVSKLSFEANSEKTEEFIALFSPADQKGNFKCFKIPFGKKEIPWGSYKIISQFQETLFIAIKNKKITLDPGKSFIINTEEFEESSRIQMIVYKKVNGDFVESGGQDFAVNNRQRGILFLTTRRKRMHVIPLVELNSPIEQSIDYNSKPRTIEVEKQEIKSLVPVGNF